MTPPITLEAWTEIHHGVEVDLEIEGPWTPEGADRLLDALGFPQAWDRWRVERDERRERA